MEGFASTHFNKVKKGVWFFKKLVPMNEVLSFSRQPITSSLIKTNNQHVINHAPEMFKRILSYMGCRKTTTSKTVLAREVIDQAIVLPGLRDEIYCQLIKQTTGCPEQTSTLAAWELMLLSAGSFPPSRDLESYLEAFLAQHAQLQEERFSFPEQNNYVLIAGYARRSAVVDRGVCPAVGCIDRGVCPAVGCIDLLLRCAAESQSLQCIAPRN